MVTCNVLSLAALPALRLLDVVPGITAGESPQLDEPGGDVARSADSKGDAEATEAEAFLGAAEREAERQPQARKLD